MGAVVMLGVHDYDPRLRDYRMTYTERSRRAFYERFDFGASEAVPRSRRQLGTLSVTDAGEQAKRCLYQPPALQEWLGLVGRLAAKTPLAPEAEVSGPFALNGADGRRWNSRGKVFSSALAHSINICQRWRASLASA